MTLYRWKLPENRERNLKTVTGINDGQIEQMSKALFRFCLSKTGSTYDAEDLAQEIMLVACKTTNDFVNEKAFYAFVWKTAANILKSWYRRQARQRTEELDEQLPDHRYAELEEQAEDHEQFRLILRELARLSSDHRRVSVSYYIDGRSVREIAGDFSLSESMVKYLLFQSRKRIREGIVMEREPGRLSYDPVELTLFFWGGRCPYYGIFDGSRIRQNVVMACYYDKMTEEELSLQTGVPAAYLGSDLKKLVEFDLLKKSGMSYQSNIVIVTKKELEAIRKYSENDLKAAAGKIREFVDENAGEIRALGFYGSDMPANSLKWMLVSLILRRAYVDMLMNDVKPEYPTDCFGNRCFRFLMETRENDPYFMGISNQSSEEGSIFFWDVPVNGEMLHPVVSTVRADMLISLADTQPATDSEKVLCAELLELSLARKEGNRILPNFPCLTRQQGGALNDRINPVGRSICENAKGRLYGIAGIMREYAPEHLAGYAAKLPALFQLREAEIIMRILCESGWLLPVKDSMSATTVMMKSK